MIFTGVFVTQFLIILFLAQRILHNKKNTLGEVNINPIAKEKIQYTSDSLKYFYEPTEESTKDTLDNHPLEIEYSYNSDGLHDIYDYSVEKPPDTYRIITLGDSFTFGLFMKLEENWTEILEDKLNNPTLCKNINKVEVINLGVYGYDIEYALERYKLRGAKYNPDLIMWFLKADDVFQINEIIMEKERYYADKISEEKRIRYAAEGNYYPSWDMAMEDLYDEYGPEKLKDYQKVQLKQFDSLYQGKVLIIGFEQDAKEVKDLLREYTHNDSNKYLLGTLPNAVTHPDLYIPNDGHPNEKGHKVIAEEVFKYVKKNNIIPCN